MSYVKVVPENEEFHVKACFEEKHGDLVAEAHGISFYSGKRLRHRTPYIQISEVTFREIDDKPYIDFTIEGTHLNFALEEGDDDSELFYLHMKEMILDERKIKNFLRDRVELKTPQSKKMFDNECMAWIMDNPPLLFSDEYVHGALVGRMGQDFSHHGHGVLFITSRRVFFNGRNHVYREMDINDIKSCHVIHSDPKFVDSRGRKTYSIEFNDSDYVVCVQSDLEGKIECFYDVFPENIVTVDRF
ncbi:hypothetical protein A9Q84_17135 [Halobacteriovorax marinus]|uniref:Uncharacterized protein n=1 Tax=Halobacteriovorax marinus TaxID=97084 RepID=A0A1Y5F3M8_9BACT|nr:hypothetical protein A9Q84_17135 [Halobacteriovorax marinus]